MMDNKLLAALAAHADSEERAYRTYEQLAAWCEWQSWVGCAELFRGEAAEEWGHARQWRQYVLDRGGQVTVGQQDPIAPGSPQDSLVNVFTAALGLEIRVLAEINSLSTQAAQAADWDAVAWMRKYLKAGRKQIKDLGVWVATLKRAGTDMAALQAFDRAIGKQVKK